MRYRGESNQFPLQYFVRADLLLAEVNNERYAEQLQLISVDASVKQQQLQFHSGIKCVQHSEEIQYVLQLFYIWQHDINMNDHSTV